MNAVSAAVTNDTARADLCRTHLDAMVHEVTGIESAAVVTGDGFEIAAVLRHGVSGNKLAAMTSSLLALSEAVVEELKMRGCRNVIIEGEGGTVVMIRVPARGTDLLMSVLCRESAVLGSVLYAARMCAARIGVELEHLH